MTSNGLPVWKRVVSDSDLEVYRRAGYQREYGLGSKPALLIIDVEYNFTGDIDEPILSSIAKYPDSCGPAAWLTIPRIQRLLEICRKHNVPIAFTHGNEEPDTIRNPRLGTAIIDELAPAPGELVLAKDAASAFFGTNLIGHLIKWRADTVIYAGCVTSGCVRASVVDGAAYGYLNAIVEDCVFDRAQSPHLMSLFDMDAKYGDVQTLKEVEDYLAKLSQTPS